MDGDNRADVEESVNSSSTENNNNNASTTTTTTTTDEDEDSRTCWAVTEFPLSVVDGPIDASPRNAKVINLVDHMLEDLGSTADRGGKLYLSDFNDASPQYRKTTLLPTLNAACKPLGFQVVAKGWEKQGKQLRIHCCRSRTYKKNPEKDALEGAPPKKRRQSSTKRPLDKTLRCRFHFTIKWDESCRLWYIHERNPACMVHSGHCRGIENQNKKVKTPRLLEEEEDGAENDDFPIDEDGRDDVDDDDDDNVDEETAHVEDLLVAGGNRVGDDDDEVETLVDWPVVIRYKRPTEAELQEIRDTVIRPGLVRQRLQEQFVLLMAQCVTEEQYFIVEQVLHSLTETMKRMNHQGK